MKKIKIYLMLLFAFLLVLPISIIAQEESVEEPGNFDVTNVMDQQSSFGALLGYTDIGGQKYMGMRIQPEFAFGKLGFGLDIPFLANLLHS